jgi:hypothetical protein
MVMTTPRRPRRDGKIALEKPLDIEAIAEEAQIEELSVGMEQMRGGEIEVPISIPASAIKQVPEDQISIGASSGLPTPQRPPIFEERDKKRRSYLADVKDAIKKSGQKVKEKAHKGSESAEKMRGDQSRLKLSSLSGAGTIGLFTPLQLVF